MDLAQNESYQTALKNIRVKYILDRIGEEEFSAAIFKEDKKNKKFQKKRQLLQMMDNVGTDLLQNYAAGLDKKCKDYIGEMIKLVREFTQIVIYFNDLSSKYHSEFNSWIGLVRILVNNKESNEIGFGPRDVIKYQY
jgi:hypothetical protein